MGRLNVGEITAILKAYYGCYGIMVMANGGSPDRGRRHCEQKLADARRARNASLIDIHKDHLAAFDRWRFERRAA